MNAREQAELERERLNLVRFPNRSGSHVNCVRIFQNNTIEHEQRKFDIACFLIRKGHKIITEAIFTNGARADVLDITTGTVYEVLCSETIASCEAKVKKYPDELEVLFIKAKDLFSEKDINY